MGLILVKTIIEGGWNKVAYFIEFSIKEQNYQKMQSS
jgi:hypothetical protein